MATPAVVLGDGWLRVDFGGSEGTADYHFRWLRHNCDIDRHPTTRERIVCSSELPTELPVSSAVIDGDKLKVTWAYDGRTSEYALSWLLQHAYARNRTAVPPPPSDLSRIEVSGEGLTLEQRVQKALANLDEHGAALVRRPTAGAGAPQDETEQIIAAFEAVGLKVIPTHFGRIEDLRTDNTTNANTDQLGYTNAGVDLHTDQPFLENPPRLQLLQSIRCAEEGGDNYVVDARAAADYLASIDSVSHQILRDTPAIFHRKQKAFEAIQIRPIIKGFGKDFQVRYSYFTLAPHKVDFDKMESWYAAYDKFARLVRDTRHQYRFGLQPGDFLLYDNHRMMHARTPFRGGRWVRGIYFDR